MHAEPAVAEPTVERMDISTYLFPNELRVTDVPLKKMLMVGSCLSTDYVNRFRNLDPGLEIDYIPFNNVRQLPELNAAQLDSYQLQYIQIPLRVVLTDRIVRIFDIDRADSFGEILENSRAILAAMLDAAMAYNVQTGMLTLVANFFVPQGQAAPSLADLGGEADLTVLIAELNSVLAHLVRKHKNAYVADVNSLANSYGKHNFLDDVVYFYGHGSVLDSPAVIGTDWAQHENWPRWSAPDRARIEPVPELAELYPVQPKPFYKLILDQIRYLTRVALQIDQVKLVIFDLDNTLWRGQIAEHYETGRQWPDLNNWPVGMWEAVHYLRRRGIVVSLCSRNDESVVRERWSRAVSLPWISLDDFVVPKINWDRKSDNVKAILAELNLTAKSALFVDDNPVVRSEVLNDVPGIRAIGGNPFLTRRILLWSPETQRSVITNESMNREASYRGIVARNAEMASMDRESFLQNLQIRIQLDHITDIDSPLLPRVLELANKTTQFNTTGLKWTPPELTTFIDNGGAVFAFSVQDKFSDYGLVGAVFVGGSTVRQYVMSCRVLGMDVEIEALKQILQIVRHQDEGPSIVGTVIPTEVNTPCRDIFVRAGFQATQDAGTFVIKKDAF